MKKRLVSVMLMVVMMINILPVLPFSTSAATTNVAKVGTTEYATIGEAIAAWTAGKTLTLLADVTLTDVIKLKSTEHHILDLSTFTMTAASGMNAIEITSNGFANRTERTALTIKANATNPGGINAGSKACVYYKYDSTLASNQYDRPIIVISGGVFTSTSNGVSSSGHSSAQDKCATFQISGGIFNCNINLTKAKLIISGGTFNGSVSCTGGSTSTRIISGGTFQKFGSLTAGSGKLTFGTSNNNYNVGVYVDENGYLVVGGSVITSSSAYEASTTYSSWSSYLQYSSAKSNDLYWTSIETAMAKKPTGTITVHVPELDLTGSSFKGTLLIPESNSDVVITFDEGTTPAWKVNPVGALDDTMMAVYTDSASNGEVTRSYKLVSKRTVKFDSQSGTNVEEKDVADGYAVDEPTAPIRNGYTFAGWFKDSACTESNKWNFDTPVTENITLYAKWMHTVTFDYGIANNTPDSIIVEHNAIIKPVNPVLGGYIFMGWYKDALFTTPFDFSAPINVNTTVYAKFADYEGDKEEINNKIDSKIAEVNASITALQNSIGDTSALTGTIVANITDLQTKIVELNTNFAVTDADLQNQIDALNAKVTELINNTVAALTHRVTAIESTLTTANANINTNTTDIASLKANIKTIELLQATAEQTIAELSALAGTNQANIAELQKSVAKLQESIYAADGKIAAAEARIAVLEGKVEELEGVKNELQAAVMNLQAAISTKADHVTVSNAIANLNESISALKASQGNYIYADMSLRAELTAAIEAAKNLAVSTATDLVTESRNELQAAIDKKADSVALEAKAAELAGAIALAEATAKNYADAQDAILKDALDAEIKAANELIASLDIRMTDAETAIDNIEAAIDNIEAAVEALEKATADDAQALKDAVAALNQAIADAKALAADADSALETALKLMISEAQKALESKVSKVQSDLGKAIKELKAADASNADELKKAIATIEAAMAAAESARAASDTALESKLTEAQTELSGKIAQVQANLDTAKAELSKALESGDTALGEKIKALNDALDAAKAASEASDASLKTELTAKIDEADAAIYALIEKIQKELQAANAELNTAMEEGDDELNTQFIVSTSVASVGVAGNIALLAWIIISKKRRLF